VTESNVNSREDLLPRAIALHRQGRLNEAEDMYRELLAADSNSADALHFPGVLKHQLGQSDLAIEYIGRAVELEPAHAGMRSNLGNVFMESGRLAAAEACYLAAIELAPDFADAHCNLAVVLRAGRGRRAGRQSVGDREGIGASGRVESRTRGVDRLRPVPARVVFVCMSVPAPTPRPM